MNKKRIISLLAGISTLCLFGGCIGVGSGNNNDSKEPVREKVVTIADFETWETGIQLIRTGKYFGAIHQNEDATYVKSGKGSALLHPLGGFRSSPAPILFFPTASETYDFDHSDFSDADKITFEFYNAEETEINVAVGLVTSITGIDTFQRTSLEYQPLKTGWNTVTYEVNVSALSINADVKSIKGIFIGFENFHSREEADAPDVYLDDVILYRKDSAPEIKDLVELETNEYANFEKDWQQYVVGARNTAYAPDINIVDAANYKVGEAPADGETDTRSTLKDMEGSKVSGNKVLRVFAKNGTQYANTYPGIQFSGAMLQRSLFGRLEEEDYGKVTFAFDVYNNSSGRPYVGISFYNDAGRQRKEYGIHFEPYAWTHFEINLKTLYEDFKEANKNSTELFTNPGELAIYWAEFVDGDKELFFDNFRFEVAETDKNAKPYINLAPFVRVAAVGDKIKLPTVSVTDKYDLDLEGKLSVFKKDGEEWVNVDLVSGLIPITTVGDYKIVATAKNSLGNISTVEYLFKGVESVEDNLWTSYAFDDEVSNIHLDGEISDTNKVQWVDEITLGGVTKEGVIKAITDNAGTYGAGYIGFRFPKQRMDEANDAGWDYFTISVYIEAPVSTVNILSFNTTLLENIPTNCWTELKISRKLLNNGKTWVNNTKTPLSDTLFNENFLNICGSEMKALLFTNTLKANSANNQITYYIDKVTWGKYADTNFSDGDDYAEDIYQNEWADPWGKKNEE